MSSIRLKKDYDGKKKDAIISVPFALGKVLVEQGIGEYPGDLPTPELQALQVPPPAGPVAKGGEVKQSARPHEGDETEPHVKPEFPPQPAPEPGKVQHKQK